MLQLTPDRCAICGAPRDANVHTRWPFTPRKPPASNSDIEKAFYEALPAEVKATLRAMEDP